jgi:hypothetical protein
VVRNVAEGVCQSKALPVRMAEVHVAKIKAEFGPRRLDSIRPSEIKSWIVKLKAEGYAPSYMFALHSLMAQIYSDAIQDGIVTRSPLSRRTSPGMGKQRPYVATTDQVWALHDAMEPAVSGRAAAGRVRRSKAC